MYRYRGSIYMDVFVQLDDEDLARAKARETVEKVSRSLPSLCKCQFDELEESFELDLEKQFIGETYSGGVARLIDGDILGNHERLRSI